MNAEFEQMIAELVAAQKKPAPAPFSAVWRGFRNDPVPGPSICRCNRVGCRAYHGPDPEGSGPGENA